MFGVATKYGANVTNENEEPQIETEKSSEVADSGRRRILIGAAVVAGVAAVGGVAFSRRTKAGSNAASDLVLTDSATTTTPPSTTVDTIVGKVTGDSNDAPTSDTAVQSADSTNLETNVTDLPETTVAGDGTKQLPMQALDRSTEGPFAGFPVGDFPGTAPQPGVAVRLNVGWEDTVLFDDLVKQLASHPDAAQLEALVIGAFASESLDTPDAAITALVSSAPAFPNVKALFFGDVAQERSEISWINCGDQASLAEAFPKLQVLRIRGAGDGRLTNFALPELHSLIIETGGLRPEVVREVLAADLPSLRYLSLWLGTPEYGGETTLADLAPLLEGRVHPGLQHLGLPNSAIADEVAAAVSRSPLIDTIEELDFSRGTIGDAGFGALTQMGPTAKLRTLDVSHHYASFDAVVALDVEMKKRNVRLDASDRQQEEDNERWVSISE